MKLTVLEFNKTTTPSIDEFSDFVQKIINENNDLVEFRSYENQHSGNIKVELLFGDERTRSSEIMAFGPAPGRDVLDQVNATLEVAAGQSKKVKFAGLVPMSASIRSIGFVVLEKSAEIKGNSSAEVSESEKRTEDKAPNEGTVRRRKNTKQS